MGVIDVDLYEQIREATLVAINKAAYEIYLQSQKEVPKAVGAELERSVERYGESLTMSGKYPGPVGAKAGRTGYKTIRPELGATAENLEASVVYESPYALAQHEGEMVYQRDGKGIHWQAENYTTAGTKKHYLSDPAKAMIPLIPEMIGTAIEAVLAEFNVESLAGGGGAAMGIAITGISVKP